MARRDDIDAQVAQQRARHATRPRLVRLGVGLAGGLSALAGLALIIPLPEAGVPLVLLGLRLLALEFGWAATAYTEARWRWAGVKRRWAAQPAVRRYGLMAVSLLVVAGLIWGFARLL